MWAVAGALAATALLGPSPAPAGAAEARLAGTVTSEAGGPVAGVRVRLYRDGTGYTEHFADTATDGTWAIPGVPDGAYRVVFSDPTLAHVAEWWGDTPLRSASTVVDVAGGDEDLDVALARGAEVRGTIATPGAFDVHLYAGDPATTSATQVLRGQSGGFSFKGLPAGTYRVLVKDPTGTVRDLWGPNRFARADALPVPVVAGQVATATYGATWAQATFGGTVVDVEGPVAGVNVQLYDVAGTFVRTVKTDAEGAYRFKPVPAGRYVMAFRDPTGAHATRWSTDGPVVGGTPRFPFHASGEVTYDVELAATATLRGEVTADGQPRAGVRVIVHEHLDRGALGVRSTLTAADGSWSIPGLEPRDYLVGYSDPAGVLAPEYHGDVRRLAESEPITLASSDVVDLEAVLAQR